ncbi:MAG TPA: hypothetical protein VL992_18280 [Tepidisphaeraceae bacterium]|nr:hypothetical protein [Tepidisphaeraceae bacterium]
MKVLFDHNFNRHFKRQLRGHEIKTAREACWDKLDNGMLLQAAANAGFDLMLTIDKNIQYQRDLHTLPIAVVVLDSFSNAGIDSLRAVRRNAADATP